MSSIRSHNFDERLQAVLHSVSREDNQATILDYVAERRANGVRPSTLYANACVLRTFSNFLEAPFKDAERRDLNAYANSRAGERVYRSYSKEGGVTETVRKRVLSDSTMDHHKVVLRTFYKWLYDTDEFPESVRHLKTRTAKNNGPGTERLISREELESMLQAAPDPRLKALLAVMYETGLRAGEIVALNVESVQIDSIGAQITIPPKAPGLKTGSRTVRVLPNESAPYLQAWLELHPFRHSPSHCLFHGSSRRNPYGRMLPSSLYTVVKTLVRRAGIQRHIKPHDFRHTAATEKARLGYNEAHLRHYFGWSRTSDMPSTYVHLAGADFEAMMLQKHGIEVPEERPRKVMHAPCPVCSLVNPTTNVYCMQCRRPLKQVVGVDALEQGNDALLSVVREMIEERLDGLRREA